MNYELIVLGMAFSAFGILAQLQDGEFPESLQSIETFSSPKKKVVVTRDFDAPGKFVLLPETTAVLSTAVGKFENKSNKAVIINIEPSLPGFVFTADPCVAEKNQHPFWHILETTTSNEEEANLTWAKIAVSSLSGVNFFGNQTPHKIKRVSGKQAAPVAGESLTYEQIVTIPILVNSRPLEANEQLKLYRREVAKRAPDAQPITPAKILRSMAEKAKLCERKI